MILRRAAGSTTPALLDAIYNALSAFHPSECANYLTATEYKPKPSNSALVQRKMTNGLDIMSIRIKDKSSIVMLMVVRAQTWTAVVNASG